jgi:hypothetical protein
LILPANSKQNRSRHGDLTPSFDLYGALIV